MPFKVKNNTKYIQSALGYVLNPNKDIDLLDVLVVDIVKQSILSGELYRKIMGRVLTIVDARDFEYLDLTTDETSFISHAGFSQGYLGSEDLKPPFIFDGYGQLMTSAQISTGNLPNIANQFLSGELVNTTNLAPGTHYYAIPMDTYSHVSVQGIVSGGVTVTIETSDDVVSVVPLYTDITRGAYDAVTNTYNNVSFIDTSFFMHVDEVNCWNARIAVVCADATNSVRMYFKKKF